MPRFSAQPRIVVAHNHYSSLNVVRVDYKNGQLNMHLIIIDEYIELHDTAEYSVGMHLFIYRFETRKKNYLCKIKTRRTLTRRTVS